MLLLCLSLCGALVVLGPEEAVLAIGEEPPMTPSLFGASPGPRPGIEAEVAFADPLNACGPLLNPEAVAGKVVFTYRGGCSFQQKADIVESAGGLVAVVVNQEETQVKMRGVSSAIPCVMVGKTTGDTFRNFTSPITVAVFQDGILAAERVVLKSIRDGLQDTSGLLNWPFESESTDPCNDQWDGILCSATGHVLVIDLGSSLGKALSLTGTLSPLIGELSKLTILTLDYNELHGEIPASLQNIHGLNELNLIANKFTGGVPFISGLKNIKVLFLTRNNLDGTLEDLEWASTVLDAVDLSHNRFSGSLPSKIVGTSVSDLKLSHNAFTGQIPASWRNFSDVWYIDIGHNQLEGTVPSMFGDLPSLGGVVLDNNNFEEVAEISSSNLELFSASNNQLRFPLNFSGATSLRKLGLANNLLSGPMEADLPPGLREIDVSNNQITSFNDMLKNEKVALEIVLASHNQLAGSFLDAAFYQLSYEGLHSSFSAGRIRIVDVSHNVLTGVAGGFGFDELAHIPNAINVDLSHNAIEGVLSIVSLDAYGSLLSLDLSNNMLRGGIPDNTLDLYPAIEVIDLRGNNLRASKLPSFLTVDTSVVDSDAKLNAVCPTMVVRGRSDIDFHLDPSYTDYNECICRTGYKNVAGVCVACKEGLRCMGYPDTTTPYSVVRRGYYETTNSILIPCRYDFVNLATKFNPCNPTDSTVQYSCMEGHIGRMCSACEVDWFMSEGQCRVCGVMTYVNVVILAVVMLVFFVALRTATSDNLAMVDRVFPTEPPIGTGVAPTPQEYDEQQEEEDDDLSFERPVDEQTIGGRALPPINPTGHLAIVESDTGESQEEEPKAAEMHQPRDRTKNRLAKDAGGGGGRKGGGACVIPIEAPRTKGVEEDDASNAELKGGLSGVATIVINHCQTLAIVLSGLRMPEGLETFIRLLALFELNAGSVNAGCIVHDVVDQYVYSMLAPVAIYGVLVFFIILMELRAAKCGVSFLFRIALRSLLFILAITNLFYFPIAKANFEVFLCHPDEGSGINYLQRFPHVECDRVPMAAKILPLLGYTIGLPAVLGSVLVFLRGRYPHPEVSPRIYATFGVLFEAMKPNLAYVVLLYLLRRFLLAIVVATSNSVVQPSLVTFVLAGSIAFTSIMKPFKTMDNNLLEILSFCTILLTFVASVAATSTSFNEDGSVSETLGAVLLVPNILFFVCAAVAMRGLRQSFANITAILSAIIFLPTGRNG